MRKYQLATDYQFWDANTAPILSTRFAQHTDVQRIQRGELFVLHNPVADKTMLLNPAIHAFLQLFQQPQTITAATANFAQQADCSVSAIEPTVQQFFKAMRRRKILERWHPPTTSANQMVTETTLLPTGQVLGAYRIEECVREKSRVVIYRATRLGGEGAVAIKMLKLPTDLSSKQRKKRIQVLRQECELLNAVQGHPNLCELLEMVVSDTEAYAVMEYLEGYSWGRFIRYEQPNLSTRLQLAEQFLSAMAFIHRRGILHGDLHSGNIIIEEPATVKIIDFDLANRAHLQPKELQREGGVIHYIPPERISDTCFDTVNGAADFRSEVFQMGVILYRLFYEKMPFSGFTWRELSHAIKKQPAPLAPTTPLGEVIPPKVIQLLATALQKERQLRFADAQEIYTFFTH